MKSSLISDEVIKKELKLLGLLKEAELVGGIYNMGYEECLILTNDIWKQNAGGVPKHCFLLATVMEAGKAPKNEDDEEIILLRVIGPADLPTERELLNVRSDAMREIITEKGRESAKEPSQILDILTRNEIQFSGIKAKVLGTFYEKIVNSNRILNFGSDIDNFYSASRYKVYKPYGKSLEIIACYPEITKLEELQRQKENLGLPERVQIGTIRYGSTDRRAKKLEETKPTKVPVKVNIEDFVSMKTAIFGMTRMGKSNTLKIIATSVFKYSIKNKEKIGQLFFDPTGEYANVNPQDNTALSQIGKNYVTIFKYGKSPEDEDVKPLQLNFYEELNVESIWAIISNYVSNKNAEYFKSFISADVIGPPEGSTDYSALNRSANRRSALYATLKKAGFQVPKGFKSIVNVNQNILNTINEDLDEGDKFKQWGHGKVSLTSSNLELFWDNIAKTNKENANVLKSSTGKFWVDTDLDAILNVYAAPRTRTGFKVLKPLRSFHTPDTKVDYVEEVLKELKEGKIVIIDLSLGDEAVLQACSERIIHGILNDATENFIKDQELSKIQVFIEEAHRLFNRIKFERQESADPYVRLAKEAAKYKIGLVYATQEVTSVDSQVLANTSNWIVTHLNNHKEVSELSKYYNFKDFYNQIIESEDVGFTRIKTKSGRYIIPTQIDPFTKERIDEAKRIAEETLISQGD